MFGHSDCHVHRSRTFLEEILLDAATRSSQHYTVHDKKALFPLTTLERSLRSRPSIDRCCSEAQQAAVASGRLGAAEALALAQQAEAAARQRG